MNKKIIIVSLILLAVLGWFLYPKTTINTTELAQCLSEKGVVMYGASWCGHCAAQKEMFGEAFELINYVDCDENALECSGAGVKGYPTWAIKGYNYPGERSLSQLAKLAGC